MQKVNDESIDLTFYPAPTAERRGSVIVCPGGGYQGLAAHEGEPVARRLNRAGIAAFLLRYRLTPNHYPAQLEDASRAVRLVRARADEFNVHRDRIGILGFSAGGHLVTTLATHFDAGDAAAADPVARESSRPDAVVACYPVVSMTTLCHEGCRDNLLGPNAPEALAREVSNELHVTAETPPTFLWHTAEDAGVPVGHSLLMAEALSRAGVPFELHVFPHGQHGLGLADETSDRGNLPAVAQWAQLCVTWLESLGFTRGE